MSDHHPPLDTPDARPATASQHHPARLSRHPSRRRARRSRTVPTVHLLEPGRRPDGRRRVLQRCSALVATLVLGATQCDTAAPVAVSPANVAEPTPQAAVVPGPDGTVQHGRCSQYEDLLAAHAPAIGWDVARMSKLMWRESACWPAVRSRTSDTGLLQINDVNLEFLRGELGEAVDPTTLSDPVQNVRAAAALCTYWARNGSTCYQPWAATDR